jgi:(p)ppGpp synthase/HD superfamily hydrolase
LRQGAGGDLNAATKHNIRSALRFLKSAGAHETHHSGKDLLRHLTNTYRVLRRWGCPEHLCVAGLFHSVYGTEAFKHATFTLRQRYVIREKIGPEAELTVYLYCIATHRSLYENLEREPPYSLRSYRNGRTIPISRNCLAELMALDLANSLEQLSRIGLTPTMMETDRAIYEKAIPLLPGAAIVEMHWVYQSRNIAAEELPLEAQLERLDSDAQARIERVLLEALAKEQA